jgi:hypothetical protein
VRFRSNDSGSRFLPGARSSYHVPVYSGFMLPCPHQHRKVWSFYLYSFIFKDNISEDIPRAAGCSYVGLFRELDPCGLLSYGFFCVLK